MFVEHPEAPPENNAAERGLRPLVLVRKVSGGTRSDRSSMATAILRRLFGTWNPPGVKRLVACIVLLASADA